MERIFSGFLTIILVFNLFSFSQSNAQQTGYFSVGGDINSFYPVTWYDGAWASNKHTELNLGRSSIHANNQWR
ncbi:hypothetical protein MM239_18995 [Belliella sp. DSM 111904]|uniref:Uncharacterized protein n=1 Tax=Belliella filtrata TaxID=2923435 RepID=A0ABS9V508_9BACT|nr:hypothetical protein [Belliella filtrata]MCH7411483.1 hypothetical protein [Belliella filtrata]